MYHRSSVDQLIRTGQLAPRAVVEETGSAAQHPGEECPICFNVWNNLFVLLFDVLTVPHSAVVLYCLCDRLPQSYFALNCMNCCAQAVCTECYLALKSSKDEVHCPYCDSAAFEVKFTPKPQQQLDPNVATATSQAAGQDGPTATKATPEPQRVVTNSIADRRDLEAQIAKQRELDLAAARAANSSSRSGHTGMGGSSRFRGHYSSGGGSRAAPRHQNTNLPDDLLSINDYMSFYQEMRGSPSSGGGTSGAGGGANNRSTSSAVNRERYGRDDPSRPPGCSECAEDMVISSYAQGGYANGLFICNLCQSTRRCSDSRWFCRDCSADYCFSCRRSNRSDLPSEPSAVPSRYQSGGNVANASGSHSAGSGGRARHRYYASRSSQQTGLVDSLHGADTGQVGVPVGGGGQPPQWEQESDLLEDIMLLEAIQLSLQLNETDTGGESSGPAATGGNDSVGDGHADITPPAAGVEPLAADVPSIVTLDLPSPPTDAIVVTPASGVEVSETESGSEAPVAEPESPAPL